NTNASPQAAPEDQLRPVRRIARPGMAILDLGGADGGAWAGAALALGVPVTVHCFEPDYERYVALLRNRGGDVARGAVVPHNFDALRVGLTAYARHAQMRRVDVIRVGPGIDPSAVIAAADELLTSQR